MFELMAACLKPLRALGQTAGTSDLGHLGQIPRGMIEVEDLNRGMRFQEIPIARRTIGDPHINCLRIEVLHMGDLSLHPLHKSGLSILRGRPHINRVQSLTVPIIEREGLPSPADSPPRTTTDRSHPDQWRRYGPVLSSAGSHNASFLPWPVRYSLPLPPDSVNRSAPPAVHDSQPDRFPLGSNRSAQIYSPPPWQIAA